MSKYVDGFVLVVPNDKEEAYAKMCLEGRDAWMKHGALQYFECKGNDLIQHLMGDQKSRDYKEMTGAGQDENVWFSFIIFESKEHRDQVNQKVMAEMGEAYKDMTSFEMPNDLTKMAYGGFEVVVEG